MLSVSFLFLVFIVPLAQIFADRGEFQTLASLSAEKRDSIAAAVSSANQSVLKNIDQLETQPEEESLFRRIFLPSMQYVFLRFLSHDAWELPVQTDPVLAIVHFRDQLELRGIDLLIVPVPVKGGIEPENFVDLSFTRPLRNRGWPGFVSQLEEHNVRIFDVAPVLIVYSRKHGGAFLRTDTHWQPGAMESYVE